MDKVAVRKARNAFKFHARIVWKGFYRVLCGALIAVLLAISVYGFMAISTAGGWAAVADFILSNGLFVLSGLCIYGMGKGGKNG